MKPLLVFTILACALLALAALAVGVMVSVSSGRPSVLLIGVFALDSVLLLVIAWRLVLRRSSRREADNTDHRSDRRRG